MHKQKDDKEIADHLGESVPILFGHVKVCRQKSHNLDQVANHAWHVEYSQAFDPEDVRVRLLEHKRQYDRNHVKKEHAFNVAHWDFPERVDDFDVAHVRRHKRNEDVYSPHNVNHQHQIRLILEREEIKVESKAI